MQDTDAKNADETNEREVAAARVIQRAFRNSRRNDDSKDEKAELQEDGKIGTQKRWDDAILRNKLESKALASSKSNDVTPRGRWQRGAIFAAQIQGSDTDVQGARVQEGYNESLKERVKKVKQYAQNRDESGKRKPFKSGQKAVKIKKKLEEQHWLEMIDPRHRYGSNLKYYFEEWQSAEEAKGNFFFWLDHGAGKDLSLPKCNRERLEKEQILYLSVEQRRHYLVKVDKDSGLLRWAHPNARAVRHTGQDHPLVDTTARKWTDLGEGQGVGPYELLGDEGIRQEAIEELASDSSEDSSFDESDSSSDSSVVPARPGNLRRTSSATYSDDMAEREQAKDTIQSKSKGKKTKEKGDVWIYVADQDYKLYLGKKQKGHFQHSSFLAGGPITSAGTLVVRDGKLVHCNPMSGHYRTKADYFKRWIEEMERQGADLSEVKIRNTEIKLWFIEQANTLHAIKGKTRRLGKKIEKKLQISSA